MNAYARVILALVAPTAVALLVAGCGGHSTSSNSDSGTGAVAQAAASEPAQAAPAGGVGSASQPKGQPAGADSTGRAMAEVMPPDIAATASDTLVVPGQTVEIGVEGTPDVTEVTLSDGLNSPQALYLDAASKSWRAVYRVPLRPRSDRMALSVTARNDGNRWRRVWVFLTVRREEPAAPVSPDSTK